MRRPLDSINIQAFFLLAIVIVTIYIFTIDVGWNNVQKSPYLNFKYPKEKETEKNVDDLNFLEKNKELSTEEKVLLEANRLLNGKQNYVFRTDTLPKDDSHMPFMSNGHLGYRVYGNAVYMNGLFSGVGKETHRAWIPNYVNLRVYYCEYNDKFRDNCQYRLNINDGVFIEHILEKRFELFHLSYAHRGYKNFIVNQIFVKRREGNDKLSLNMLHLSGDEEDDEGHRIIRDDIWFDEETTMKFDKYQVNTKIGHQKDFENDNLQTETPRISVMYTTIPHELIMYPNETFVSLKYLMSVSYETETSVTDDFYYLLLTPDEELLKLHTDLWNKFWDDTPNVIIRENNNLASAIHASIFTLASSIPISLAAYNFYGPMSPNSGHTTADTELWILPALNSINSNFTKKLLSFRMQKLPIAIQNAALTGYVGARYPVKSAYSGMEVESDDNLVSALHVSADISFAMRQYYAVTHDDDWLVRESFLMSKEIAKFYESYAIFNETTGHYVINDVTGPDIHYPKVDNDVFTNVVAGYALFFGRFTECLCSKLKSHYPYDKEASENFDKVGSYLELPYDEASENHLRFSGFHLDLLSDSFNQPDVFMLQYPLEYQMKKELATTNYQLYTTLASWQNVSSLAYAIHAIASLDLNATKEANEDFNSYENFATSPFYVWCEKNESSYLAGMGAFLQALFNGYAGIRLHLDHLLIKKPMILPNTTGFELDGMMYLGAKYKLVVTSEMSHVTFKSLTNETLFIIKAVGKDKASKVKQNTKYEIPEGGLKIWTDNNFQGCKLPLDKIGEKLIQDDVPVVVNETERQETVQEETNVLDEKLENGDYKANEVK